jgi:hypothetical protein
MRSFFISATVATLGLGASALNIKARAGSTSISAGKPGASKDLPGYCKAGAGLKTKDPACDAEGP